ncbi:1-deoxy-D-xylulose-5-phosphate reductoisomerase [Arenimonas terrae]|jgi:1-deoxy-D-xylulose-5-phosphate reductoisomerase|uniref:1-deoxy-D-xylulose 5-phosphate reductoisomerase n=1 Tax=Arenimonas terrae TaxID=2546226 RepID=A0A5C4RUE0_9GAMM|nr:1-deoxy-D-xylulose-5-phosphate reductoisomerase [Arenimonas terrae]TNJ34257.1 1-deoxy-D-xylulose-5-phosphate reductoisomerase [Arenimonas terrae]
MAGPLKTIALLGATGSIGGSTLDVVARHPDRFRIGALSAHGRVDELLALCERFHPDAAVLADPAGHAALRDGLEARGLRTRALSGPAALDEIAADPANDTVVAAIVGAAGVASTLAAARAGKRLLLANKESVVVAGQLLMQAVREGGATVLPVDSEHNAIYQCLPADGGRRGVRRLLLTASGGPFRGRRREDLAGITPDQACAHPNWVMGRKISVDSATLMNKGLEVIEACHLFGLPAERIEVVVHPQSVVHSLVDYVDGSVLAQLGNPDMRTALAYGLAWPERIDSGVPPLDLAALARFDFERPDLETFPCLALAYRALAAGGGAPAVLNAANEVAVSAFLQGELGFLGIPDLIQACLDALPGGPADSLEQLMDTDAAARRMAHTLVPRMRRR